MAATATKKEVTIAQKLDALFELQKIDSEIDRIRTIRGELPLEVQDLEDEISGLNTRVGKINDEIQELETEITDRKMASKDSEAAIVKYKEQQNNVRNNREFESLSKEIEFQELEIKLHEKKSKEAKYKIDLKQETLTEATDRLTSKQDDLALKQSELDAIISETQKDEDRLLKASDDAKKKIETRLVFAYDRLRENAKNGLAVVQVMRGSCGGCFNKIPPQRQLDIVTKKKIIVCEHCGRILVPVDGAEA
ncbi:MAG: C4-type zinc ribbon domain-containing protein [Crocinitomicaceae bacterium]|jgi:predicted  nucleic acid-binding Zn-ribbon protein|nr:C4-type zinc ribbon domain-containing protein [Crocinitomicaceae bacterium]MDP4760708.1 C4-type zinc ribbon domain-containing protein [Crocinitomicaceae bacterium]